MKLAVALILFLITSIPTQAELYDLKTEREQLKTEREQCDKWLQIMKLYADDIISGKAKMDDMKSAEYQFKRCIIYLQAHEIYNQAMEDFTAYIKNVQPPYYCTIVSGGTEKSILDENIIIRSPPNLVCKDMRTGESHVVR